jgi:hypothetical protein
MLYFVFCFGLPSVFEAKRALPAKKKRTSQEGGKQKKERENGEELKGKEEKRSVKLEKSEKGVKGEYRMRG